MTSNDYWSWQRLKWLNTSISSWILEYPDDHAPHFYPELYHQHRSHQAITSVRQARRELVFFSYKQLVCKTLLKSSLHVGHLEDILYVFTKLLCDALGASLYHKFKWMSILSVLELPISLFSNVLISTWPIKSAVNVGWLLSRIEKNEQLDL